MDISNMFSLQLCGLSSVTSSNRMVGSLVRSSVLFLFQCYWIFAPLALGLSVVLSYLSPENYSVLCALLVKRRKSKIKFSDLEFRTENNFVGINRGRL